MTNLELLLSIAVCLLVISNAACLYFARHKSIVKPLDTTAEELLSDLLRGNALIRIERVAPADVLLRSPRR